MVFPLSIDVSGKKILVIDDVTDTGDTLEAAVEYLETFGPEEIRTGVLQHKECSSFIPDFYAEYVGEWRWIVYPWARHEEVFGFSEKVLTGDPAPVEEIESLLYERYGFAAGRRELEDALADLVSAGKAVGSKSGFRRS